MKKTIAGLALVLALSAAGGPSSAAPPAIRIVDRDFALLPYIEQDNLFALTLLRTQSGALVLLDATDGTPLRATSLGFAYPTGSTWGSYTSSADRHAYGAFSNGAGIRVIDLGDLSVPGPLAPVALDSIAAGAGFDPSSTQMGIIAILIGLLTEHVPAVFYVQGGQTVVLAFDGTKFRPAGLLPEEGIFYFL
jgi:hypothetical protein